MKTIKLTATKNMRSVLKNRIVQDSSDSSDNSGNKEVTIQGRSHQHKVFQKYGTYERVDIEKIDELPSWVTDIQYQYELVDSILHDMENGTKWESLYTRCLSRVQAEWILRQLEQKMDGYIRQDKEKAEKREKREQRKNTSFVIHESISLYEALKKVRDEEYRCHYCRELVRLVYRTTRDKEQWTLDRVDNERGHDEQNLVVACYACNIRRRKQSYRKFKEEYSVKHLDKLM